MSARLTRRAVLATITLAAAPVPAEISFNEGRTGPDGKPRPDTISLDLGNDMHAFREWCELLGADEDWIRHQRYDHKDQHGEIWDAIVWDQWGWNRVNLHCFEVEVPGSADDPLPDDTVTALSAIATERGNEQR